MKKILSVVAVAALIFALSVPAFAATPSVEYTVTATVESSKVTVIPQDQVDDMHENSVTENILDVEVPDDANEEGVYLTVEAITSVEDLGEGVHEELVKTVQETLSNTVSVKDVTNSVQKQINTGAVAGIDADKKDGEVLQSVEVTDVAVTLAEVSLKYTDTYGVERDVSAENFPKDGLKVAIAYGKLENKQAILDVLRWVDDGKGSGAWESVGADNFTYDANGTVNVTFDHLCSVAFVIGTVEAVYATPAEEPAGNETGKTDKDTAGSGTATKNDPSKSPQTGYDVFGWAAAVSALVFAAGYCFVSARKVTE
jgi:hypothetical protein